ncbi:cytochrome P450, family 71, subfamily B, polypeptide 34 [Hibiscus trionum]|uniref:Cytochrome P450, family 71, subfamily B, polypeptide 34 n=1 Tax=Hibiscus trionum TaxID=183268 RepID=A0A9W7MPT9_HIBTR|nr:cytochrome P450, family 71, subfamily B, polypeptide 34 [Hibiscus trionum]
MLGSFCASDFLPYVGKVIDWISELDAVFRKVINDHLESGTTMLDEDDIVSVLLRMEKDQTENSAIHITKDHIKAILMDIFLAGIDTGAITMIWAMTELARKPTAMKKAQNEIRSCVGKKGKVTENDVSQLKYLKMIIKETFRLHPPTVLRLPREAASQLKIGDYDIYPRTRIAVNVWAIGRNPDIWDNPEEFIPKRFIDSPIDFKGQHFELLPFGAGRRICPEMNMGTAVLELALANLLYFFDWKVPSGMDIDMEPGWTLTWEQLLCCRLSSITSGKMMR